MTKRKRWDSNPRALARLRLSRSVPSTRLGHVSVWDPRRVSHPRSLAREASVFSRLAYGGWPQPTATRA